MESITIGEVGLFVTFIVGLISGFAYLRTHIKGVIQNSLKPDFDGIRSEIGSLKKHIDEVDQENCKNFLVTFLADVERGNTMDEVELMRFWEEYEHYIKSGGNSYIKEKVEKLKAENKL